MERRLHWSHWEEKEKERVIHVFHLKQEEKKASRWSVYFLRVCLCRFSLFARPNLPFQSFCRNVSVLFGDLPFQGLILLII